MGCLAIVRETSKRALDKTYECALVEPSYEVSNSHEVERFAA